MGVFCFVHFFRVYLREKSTIFFPRYIFKLIFFLRMIKNYLRKILPEGTLVIEDYQHPNLTWGKKKEAKAKVKGKKGKGKKRRKEKEKEKGKVKMK